MRRRLCAAYHIERSIANRLGLVQYPCACNRCRGAIVKKVEVIARHHCKHGRDHYLMYPVMTVDGQSVRGPRTPSNRSTEQYRQSDRHNADGGFTWPPQSFVDVESMARDAFGRADDIHEDVFREDMQGGMNFTNGEGDEDCNDVNLGNLVQESTVPVYEGSSQNRLQSAIVIYSLCSLYSVPQTFVDALLKWVAGDLLPTSNCFPRTSYEVKKMLMTLGLKHRQVHCCPDGHVLYEGENEAMIECPLCKQSRFVPGSNRVPKRVVRYFDFIQHVLRMFKCPEVAKHLTWCDSHKSRGQMMRSAADSFQWKTIDQLFPEFAAVKTNLRLGLVADGIIPFKNNAIKHSSWVFLITIFNLPPWLLTKKFFISLVLIVPGPKAATAENIDVFLQPIITDLLKLWNGVPATNMSEPEGQQRFILRAMLILTINDFPAYGLLSGQQVHGYKGCPLCGPETCGEHAGLLGKMVYLGARRFLDRNHHFRRATTDFNNFPKWHLAPDRPTGEEVLQWGMAREAFLMGGGVENSSEDPVKLHGVKRRSCFYNLPYWKFLLVRHGLDPMHCEKNICENILKTVFGEKDSPAVRADMEARNIRPSLHLQRVNNNPERYYMPDANYVLSAADKGKVLRVLQSLQTPTHYASALHSKISKGKLSGLKSHDFHVLLQQILPVCFRTISNKPLARAVIRLSRVFRKICAKAVDNDTKDELMADCAETMCMLEKEMPPSFFDIMSHLPNHLVEELFLLGPVHTRWMYPYERYFKTLKGFVRNLAKPEGSIAVGYETEQALGFITEYMAEYNITSRRVWDDKEDPTMVDEEPEGKGKRRVLSEDLRNVMHDFVLDNATQLEPYRITYNTVHQERTVARAEFRRRHPRRNGRMVVPYPIDLQEISVFAEWIKGEVQREKDMGLPIADEVLDSCNKPSLVARKFRSMYSYGYHYRVKSVEENITRTCDSGVVAVFRRPCRSGVRDANPVEASLEYVGQILEIVELNYGRHCNLLFVCEWVRANYRGRNATMRKDEWGFSMANFDSLLPFGYESFAFPIQCDQVFFSDVEEEPGWKIVLRNEVRGRRVDSEMDEGEPEMFRMREISENDGLSASAENNNCERVPSNTGRNIGVNEVLGVGRGVTDAVFDRDVGESSEDND